MRTQGRDFAGSRASACDDEESSWILSVISLKARFGRLLQKPNETF